MGSRSISADSAATMNTSTDSANTATTLMTVTDSGDMDDIIEIHLEERIGNGCMSMDKDEEFINTSCNEGAAKIQKNEAVVFPDNDIKIEDYEDEGQTTLQHTTIIDSANSMEDFIKPRPRAEDPSNDWYNIKMRQQKFDITQKRALPPRRKLRFLSKRYTRCYFEEERVRKDLGRNSSGFAAEQMTLDSEDSVQWESIVSPPIPTSPTDSISPTDDQKTCVLPSSPSKQVQHFTFPPPTEANDLHNVLRVKMDRSRKQTECNLMNKELANNDLITKKPKVERNSSVTSTCAAHYNNNNNNIQQNEIIINNKRDSNITTTGGGPPIGVATIIVQQASEAGNSPDHQLSSSGDASYTSSRETVVPDLSDSTITVHQNDNNNIMKNNMLDVSTNLLIEWQKLDSRCGMPHHTRSQSVRTAGSKSNIQTQNGSCRYRPSYLCLPQQRLRVASMPNTGVEEEYYRLRQFSVVGKAVVNRGDSLKSRRSKSNNSVASSNSSHSTEHITSCHAMIGNCSSHGGASAIPSLPSSRESSCASCPGINPPYRVVMLGASGVGKSSLVSQFMTSEYLQATGISIDDDFGEKSVCVSLDNEESEIMFIDQPSSKMTPEECITSYDSPHGYCVVYSTTDRESFLSAEHYLQILWKKDFIRTKSIILVGNKTDLVRIRSVTTEEGSKMATDFDCKFIETSVGINHNVDELLVGILSQIRLKLDNPPDPSIPRDQYARRRSKSPHGNYTPRLYRGSKTSASLRVRKMLSKVWSMNSKSKSCENLHVL